MRIGTAQCHNRCRVRALMLALALVFVQFCAILPGSAESDGMVRVMLTRLGAPDRLVWTADCDYYLASDPAVRISGGSTATVIAGDDGLTLNLNGQTVPLGPTAKLMRAETGVRGIRFTQPELSNRFCGDLGLQASGGVITAILNIYIEDYLYGTLGYVLPPSAGVEALKAMAVAARTAVLRRRSNRGGAVYDLTDTGRLMFKGYSGSQDYANVVRAVDDTRGFVLYYDGALAQCAWCASNGGQSESSHNAGGPNLPYAVVRDDPYDFASPSAAVKTATINKDLTGVSDDLYAALTQGVRDYLEREKLADTVESFRLVNVESVTACESRFPAPSRLYKSLTFKLTVAGTSHTGETRTGSVSVSIPTYGGIESWYDLSLNPEDNETVWVTEGERAFTVSFRRAGNGVGLSQRGAQVMAEKGLRASDILAFYYPGVEGKRLNLRDTTAESHSSEPSPTGKAIATARLSEKTDLLDVADDTGTPTATMAAGAVVDLYGAQGEWAAVGSSGIYGFIRADRLESASLSGADVTRPEGAAYGRAKTAASALSLPFKDAGILGTLAEGEVVKLLAWTDDWRMVEYQGREAFVSTESLEITAVETPEATETPAADPDAFVAAGDNMRAWLKQDAPLFEAPNALSSTVLTLKQGDAVTVMSYNREWAWVRTQSGKEGFLRLESITAAEEAGAADPLEGGAIQKVKGTRYLFVSAGVLPVYKTYSTKSDTLLTLFYGDRVQLGAYNETWACVRFNGVTGYVSMAALVNKKPAAIEGGNLTRAGENAAVTVTRDAALYDLPNESTQLDTLSEGQKVTVLAANSAWAVVRTDEATGYVRAQYLENE